MKRIRVGMAKCGFLSEGQTSDNADILTIQNLIFEPLVRIENGQIKPALIQKWQILNHGRHWLFTLRNCASFGKRIPCTSTDVIEALESARNSIDAFGMRGPFNKYLQDLEFKEKNLHTFEIMTNQPTGDITEFLAELYIQKRTSLSPFPLGTAPYQISEYEEGNRILLTLKPEIMNTGDYEQIEFVQIDSSSERFTMLQSGQLEIANGLEELPHNILKINDFHWIKAVNMLSVTAFLNGFKIPFNQPQARLAINYAINVKRIIKEVCNGFAIPSASVVSPYHYGFESTIQPIEYCPDKAKSHFEKVYFPDKIIVRTPHIIPNQGEQIAYCIQEDLSLIGINSTIDVQTDRLSYAREASEKKIGHLGLFDSSPFSTYRVLQDKVSSRVQSTWWQGVCDNEADQLIDDAHIAIDPIERQFKYANVLHYLNKNPPWLYLFHPINLCACDRFLSDVELTHAGTLRFHRRAHSDSPLLILHSAFAGL